MNKARKYNKEVMKTVERLRTETYKQAMRQIKKHKGCTAGQK